MKDIATRCRDLARIADAYDADAYEQAANEIDWLRAALLKATNLVEELGGHGMQQETEQGTVRITTWFRDSTGEWIGEITYTVNDTGGTACYTGETEEAARNAAFAAVGCLLLSTTWDT